MVSKQNKTKQTAREVLLGPEVKNMNEGKVFGSCRQGSQMKHKLGYVLGQIIRNYFEDFFYQQ